MSYPSRDEILASSRAWIASLLNFFPGLGSGYLYQRRWKPYFLTIGAFTSWLIIGIVLQVDKELTQSKQLVGISGLFIISIVTVTESYLAQKKALNTVKIKKEEKKLPVKKSWFK